MKLSLKTILGLLAASAILSVQSAVAQTTQSAAPRPTANQGPDPGAAYVARARALAGSDRWWADGPSFLWSVGFFCSSPSDIRDLYGVSGESQRHMPPAVPTKAFDNLYFAGLWGTGVWIVQTPQGLIMIDAMHNNSTVEQVILPQMRQMGLNPADVKYIIVTHGHADHFGGARYFQEKYGSKVLMSAEDWHFAYNERAVGARSNSREDEPKPLRDEKVAMIVKDGEKLSFGGVTIDMYLTPGHTPGSLSLIISPVMDGRERHVAGLWGGTIMQGGDRPTYAKSFGHFMPFAERAGADVILQSHPSVNNSLMTMAQVRARKPGEPNPFVIGREAYKRYMGVVENCNLANKARADAGWMDQADSIAPSWRPSAADQLPAR